MAYEYEAENHDWDMTLRAAWKLVMTGQAVAKQDAELSFSCFAGSMLLSFCAIESLLNSVAFKMAQGDKFSQFDHGKYLKHRGIWQKLNAIGQHAGISIDKSIDPFKKFEEMRVWRTAIVHSKPYGVDRTTIDVPSASKDLHVNFHSQQYTRSVTSECAQSFYGCAFDVTDLVIKSTGIYPRPSCTYKVLG